MSGPKQQRSALDQLPAAYGLALRLQSAGVADEVIAECLGIDVESVGPLLALAQAKLAAILCSPEA